MGSNRTLVELKVEMGRNKAYLGGFQSYLSGIERTDEETKDAIIGVPIVP